MILQTQVPARLLAAFCSGVPVDIASTFYRSRIHTIFPVKAGFHIDFDCPWQT